jgi:hypothetical protein
MEIVRYDLESEVFCFDVPRLKESGVELNVLYCKDVNDSGSQIVLDILTLKALKPFLEGKVISLKVMSLYQDTLKKCYQFMKEFKKKYTLPYPVNYNCSSQEDILDFHKTGDFQKLLSMIDFASEEYSKKFKK